MLYRVHYTVTTNLSAEDDFVDVAEDTLDPISTAVHNILSSRLLDMERNAVWTEELPDGV